MSSHLVTIFIPTYKRPELLGYAIESALKQTFTDIQIVVLDNASQDSTPDVIQRYAEKDARVRGITHAENLGMLGNYSYALRSVETPFFCFLSDDDLLLPHFCETALNLFEMRPDSAFTACSTLIVSKEEGIIHVPFDNWPREGVYLPSEGVLEMIEKYPVPTSILFRKEPALSIAIDLENPQRWDCDFLIQLAIQYPYVISKKPCALFFNHASSYTGSVDPQSTCDALLRMIERIQLFPQIDPKTSEMIIFRMQNALFHVKCASVVYMIQKRSYQQARRVSKKILSEHPSNRKAIKIFVLASCCSVLPILRFGISWLKKYRQFRRNGYFFQRGYFRYFKWGC